MIMRKHRVIKLKIGNFRQFGFESRRGKMESVMTVELTRVPSRSEIPKLNYCFNCINLKLGLNIWLPIESLLWLFLFVAGLYFEIIYIDETDLYSFIDEFDEWYFLLVFGNRFHTVDQKIRSEGKLFAIVNMRDFFFFQLT